MKLDGKVALITGAGSGFGRSGACLFAQEGAAVMVADIDERAGEETVRLIRDTGGSAMFVPADVARGEDIRWMVAQTVETFGRLDVFWSNAGIAGPGAIERVTEETFDRCLDVNLKAAFFGAKEAIDPLKRSGGGSVLFTSSVAGLKPSPGSPVYSITKAGLVMLTRSLALYLAKSNIRVNCLCPGSVDTPLLAAALAREPTIVDPAALRQRILDATPMGRFGELRDVASAALYLVSDDAPFMTGVALAIDGGWTAA